MKENTDHGENELALTEIKAILKPVMDYGYSLAAKLDEKERQLRESEILSKNTPNKK